MENFLKESWQRNSEDGAQRTESDKSLAAIAYEDIKKTVQNLPQSVTGERRELITEYFQELQESMQRYVESIEAFSRAKADRDSDYDSRKEFERLDENRRRIHDGLINILNILEKLFKLERLDTSWRNVVGSNRKDIQLWAQEVTDYLSTSK